MERIGHAPSPAPQVTSLTTFTAVWESFQRLCESTNVRPLFPVKSDRKERDMRAESRLSNSASISARLV